MKKIPYRFGLALALLTAASASLAQERTGDPLQGINHCIDAGEFHARSTDRLPSRSTSRVVNTASGPRTVSTADGYRLMIYRQSAEPLVNLKIERSAPGKFDADREAIMLQLDRLAATTRPPHQIAVATATHDGIDVAALHSPVGNPGVVSMVELFDASTGTIATAYILNQSAPAREYKDQAGYDALRDRLIDVLAVCMAHPQL